MQVLPSWMTTLLLAILLTYISYKLLARGFITWDSESHELHDQESHNHVQNRIQEPLLQDHEGDSPFRGRHRFIVLEQAMVYIWLLKP